MQENGVAPAAQKPAFGCVNSEFPGTISILRTCVAGSHSDRHPPIEPHLQTRDFRHATFGGNPEQGF
jgi:hypothetical protein